MQYRERPNLTAPTMGGVQVWADVAWRAGWRVQRHALTGHARLVDPQRLRRAWGGEAEMRRLLGQKTAGWQPSGRAVVLLHGLGRGHRLFAGLRHVVGEGTAIELGYPSVLGAAELHAPALARLLGELAGFERLDLVAYSMGGLVARAMFLTPEVARLPWGRAVLIATPNQGARLAALVHARLPPVLVRPPVLRGFLDGAPGLLPLLPVPTGVIAGTGGVALERWFGGPNDGVLTVDEARLPGAELARVPLLHVDMPRRAEVRELAQRFLALGSFAGVTATADASAAVAA